MNESVQRYLAIQEEVRQLARIHGREPTDITLIVVSKNHPDNELQPLYDAGCRDFGENRVQEVLKKISKLPATIHWHMVGTLQANKVSKIIPGCSLIHSVDSVQLAQKISEVSQQHQCVTPILMQVNVSREHSKHGFKYEDCHRALELMLRLPHIRVEGLMTMAPFVENEAIIRDCFRRLRIIRDELKPKVGPWFQHLSMGMSHDYKIAIEEGATFLRIGTAILGPKA